MNGIRFGTMIPIIVLCLPAVGQETSDIERHGNEGYADRFYFMMRKVEADKEPSLADVKNLLRLQVSRGSGYVPITIPYLDALRRKVDIVPILLEIAFERDLAWKRTWLTASEKEFMSDDMLRSSIAVSAFSILDQLGDERAYRVFMETYRNKGEVHDVRMWALRSMRNANSVEVRDFFLKILKESVQRGIAGQVDQIVLGHIQGSKRFQPNHLWNDEVRDTIRDYIRSVQSTKDPDDARHWVQCAQDALAAFSEEATPRAIGPVPPGSKIRNARSVTPVIHGWAPTDGPVENPADQPADRTRVVVLSVLAAVAAVAGALFLYRHFRKSRAA